MSKETGDKYKRPQKEPAYQSAHAGKKDNRKQYCNGQKPDRIESGNADCYSIYPSCYWRIQPGKSLGKSFDSEKFTDEIGDGHQSNEEEVPISRSRIEERAGTDFCEFFSENCRKGKKNAT